MLITEVEVRNILQAYKISINGVLHIGAHECEELEVYKNLGINKYNVIWIDGNKEKVQQAVYRGIPNVYYGVISDENDKDVEFKITNNGQSSSVLDFGMHQN
jgi:hypothetical protein